MERDALVQFIVELVNDFDEFSVQTKQVIGVTDNEAVGHNNIRTFFGSDPNHFIQGFLGRHLAVLDEHRHGDCSRTALARRAMHEQAIVVGDAASPMQD
jgi:hypothetical protein